MNIRTLIAGLTPLVLVLTVAGVIYLPAMFIQPTFNFIYYQFNEGSKFSRYSDEPGFEKLETDYTFTESEFSALQEEGEFFVYDVKLNENDELSFEEYEALDLDKRETSSEGFSLRYVWKDQLWLMEGRGVRKTLNIEYTSSSDFVFLGWINP